MKFFFKSISRGFKNHKIRLLTNSFLCYSVLWTSIESSTAIIGYKLEGWHYYLSLIGISFLFGLVRIYQPSKISFKIPSSDTKVEILYDDIFNQNGVVSISVNEYFDSEIGPCVSDKSLHGILINQILGTSDFFDSLVTPKLNNYSNEIVQEKSLGKNKKFPIGTTVYFETNSKKFLIFALAHTDITNNCKAYADSSLLIQALYGLFRKSRSECNGHTLNLALVGSGLSGIGLPSTQLLQLILLCIVEETKIREITKNIRIILHESKFEEIDLELIKNQWSN